MKPTSKDVTDELEKLWTGNGRNTAMVCIREFKPSVGFRGEERRLDLWAIECAPSKGLPTWAFEVKVSRTDWLRELSLPAKRRFGMAVSNYFYFVAPEGIINVDELPPMCGLYIYKPGEADTYHRMAQRHPAEYRDKVRPTWSLIASALRRTAVVACLLLGLVGCVELDEPTGPRVRPCYECYYKNETSSYQSLWLPDGRVIPVPAGQAVDLDDLGIRNYTVHEPRGK